MPARIVLLALCLAVGISAGWLLAYGPTEIVQSQLPLVPTDLPSLKANLAGNPVSPFRWLELAEGLAAAGDTEKARAAFLQAQKQGPQIPAVWVRTANFYFLHNEPDKGVTAVAKVLEITKAYDDFVFNYFDQFAPGREQIYKAILDDRRASRSYLTYLMARSRTEEALAMWDQTAKRSYGDQPLLLSYLAFLTRQKEYQMASKLWAASLPADQRKGYPTGNLIYNAGFEFEPSGSILDWTITPLPTVEIEISKNEANSGKQSLRVKFPSISNINFQNVTQIVSISSAGNYGFKAMLKMDGITTDQGVRFCFEDADTPARFRFQTEPVRGTSDWTAITANLAIPAATHGLKIGVCRMPSQKFDNKVSGTFWVDDMSLQLGVAH